MMFVLVMRIRQTRHKNAVHPSVRNILPLEHLHDGGIIENMDCFWLDVHGKMKISQ